MGLFDRIHFENDIPDSELRDREWQTKSLENALLHYRVTEDGALIAQRQEFRSREDASSPLGFRLDVVREWEERVDFHGVVEAYTYEELEDGDRRSVTYQLYFTYGELSSLERSERSFPPPEPIPEIEDESPRQTGSFGELAYDLPESMEVMLLEREGMLHLLSLRFDGSLRAEGRAGGVELSGTRIGRLDDAIVRSRGSVKHQADQELEVLVQNSSRNREYVIVIAPRGYTSGRHNHGQPPPNVPHPH